MSRRADSPAENGVRLDRWLWAARFFKTRAQAKQAIEGGKIDYEGHRGKPARDVAIGATIDITRGSHAITVVVAGLSDRRGPAREAVGLYRETEESVRRRLAERERRRAQNAAIQLPPGRPGKRDRRALTEVKRRAETDE